MKNFALITIVVALLGFTSCSEEEKENTEQEVTSEISLSDSYKNVPLSKRGHWGLGNNRVSTYSGTTYMKGSALAVSFVKNDIIIKLVLMDSDRQVIHVETIKSNNKSPYALPVAFIQDKMYSIEVYYESECYYLDFMIEEK